MRKLTVVFACLIFSLIINFSAFASRDYYYSGNYLEAITSASAVFSAVGKDICVYVANATYCFKFSEVSVFFDKDLTRGPGLITDDNGDYILIFKNRKQFYDYTPGMFRNKLKVLKEWPEKKK